MFFKKCIDAIELLFAEEGLILVVPFMIHTCMSAEEVGQLNIDKSSKTLINIKRLEIYSFLFKLQNHVNNFEKVLPKITQTLTLIKILPKTQMHANATYIQKTLHESHEVANAYDCMHARLFTR